jgi:hypothetical protein
MDSELFWIMYWLSVGAIYYYAITTVFFDDHTK